MESLHSLITDTSSATPLGLLPVTGVALSRMESLEAALESLRRLGGLRPVRGWRPLDGVRRGGARVKGPAGRPIVFKAPPRRWRVRLAKPGAPRGRFAARTRRRPTTSAWQNKNH